MYSTYPEVQLIDYVFFQEGPGLRTYQWTNEGMKVITIGMVTREGNIDFSFTNKYISKEEFEKKYKHFAIEEDDIILTTSGVSYGKIAKIKAEHLPMMMNTSLIRFNSKSSLLDQTYLYVYMRSLHWKTQMDGYALGSAQPNFGPSHVKLMKMILPSIDIQKRIANIIGSLDEKIDLNQRMNQTLEDMTMALYKHWFLDFGPFQNEEFEESILGMIPKGWKVKKLADLAYVKSGKRPKNIIESHNSIPVYGGGGIIGFTSESLFSEPVILTGRVGTIGKVYRVFDPVWPSDNTLVLIPKDTNYFGYLSTFLKCVDFTSIKRGSTQPLITQGDLKGLSLAVPDEEVIIKEFVIYVEKLLQQIHSNLRENETLIEIRDYLLPRLLSGEIELKEAEKHVEGVL